MIRYKLIFSISMSKQYKNVFVGAQSVGKTALIHRIAHGTFLNDTTTTIGASMAHTSVEINTNRVNLELWDTAG